MRIVVCFALIVLILAINQSQTEARLFRGRPLTKHGLLPPPIHKTNVLLESEQVKDEWYTQKLDHFNPTNNKTWKQRYFTNIHDMKNYKNSPVFIQLGGEGEASPKWIVKGQIATNYGPEYNAIQVLLEHRYYGKSRPTKNMSVHNLRYLTSEQALEDAATFIEFFKDKYGLTNNKWIVFGGSYPGSLSAWMRLKFPHLVSGAVASSAPVLAVLDFKEYVEVVERSLGERCSVEIRNATKEIDYLLKSTAGRKELTETFNLCDPLKDASPNDVSNLLENLAGYIEEIVQYNNDNRFTVETPPKNISFICSVMTDVSDNSKPLTRYAKVIETIRTDSSKCLDYKYKKFIKQMKDIDFDNEIPGARQWTYQTCTEFGFFQSSSYHDHIFGNHFPVDFFVQQCIDSFGNQFHKKFIENAIDFTNSNYGGLNLTLTNVIFPNGLIDPWHALGILHEINQSTQPLVIEGTAHCADMYPDSDHDPQALKDARKKIKEAIGQFLSN